MRIRRSYPFGGGVLAAALLLAACTDEPSAPAVARRPLPTAVAVRAHPAGLIRNAVRYRDSGHQPAVGRSGNARLALRALLDVNGITGVEVTTGRFDTDAMAPGRIAQLQLKLFDRAGKLLLARRDTFATGGYHFVPLRGLGLGFGVQVQAAIRGIDNARTDVVTVRDTVVFRPDLVVMGLELPLGARPGIPATISASIHERMGSMGARADCVLYVDGTPVDRARGIWVDRGGTVGCAFQHVFPEPRRYQVTVRVENVRPNDYDPSNNDRSASVELRDVFGYSASFSDYTYTSWSRGSGTGTTSDSSAGYEYYSQSADSTRYQYAWLQAVMPRTLEFPLPRVRLAQRWGDVTIQDTTLALPADFNNVGADSSYACGIRFGDGWWFQVCSGVADGAPVTWVDLNRYGGDALYYSYTFMRSWSPDSVSYYYSYNTYPYYHYGTVANGWGLTYEFVLGIDDGANVWSAHPMVPLTYSSDGSYWPPACSISDKGEWHYSYCTDSGQFWTEFSGYATGQPDTLAFTP